jgi:hypothetical protein
MTEEETKDTVAGDMGTETNEPATGDMAPEGAKEGEATA